MTPVTPSSKGKSRNQPSGSEDEWQPEDDHEEEEQSQNDYEEAEDDDDDYGSSSAGKKRKPNGSPKGKAKKQSASKGSRAPASGWTEEEVLALWHGSFRLALQNIRAVKDEEGLEKRSVQNVNMKMRSEFKKLDKSLGGDGKWVDAIKLAPGGSKKSSSSSSS